LHDQDDGSGGERGGGSSDLGFGGYALHVSGKTKIPRGLFSPGGPMLAADDQITVTVQGASARLPGPHRAATAIPGADAMRDGESPSDDG